MLLFVERPRGFRFGPYELLTDGPKLMCRSQRVAASPKVLSTLLVLAERAGSVVPKAELMALVWPDCFVDEANLTQTVFVLRRLLASEFGSEQVIETVARKGYRFAVPVLPLDAPLSTVSVSADSGSEERPPTTVIRAAGHRSFRPVLWVPLALLCCCITGLAWKLPRRLRLGPQEKAFTLERLTSHSPQNQISAVALSPNGQMLAFSDEDGIEVRPFDSVKLQTFKVPSIRIVQSLAWFPDGLHLLLSGSGTGAASSQVWEISLTGEAPRLLLDDAENGIVSSSGTQVAFLRKQRSQLWIANAKGEQARYLRQAAEDSNFTGLLWSEDDRHLLVGTQRKPGSAGHLLSAPGGGIPAGAGSLLAVDTISGAITATRSDVLLASAAMVGEHRLLFTQSIASDSREASAVWQVELDPKSGGFHTSPEIVASLSANQPHIYSLSADRAGKTVVTLSQQGPVGVSVGTWDNAHQHLVESHQLSQDGNVAYPHAWSADSTSVFYEAKEDGHWQIFRQGLDQHNGVPLVTSDMHQVSPRLTPDGKWVLFLGRFGDRGQLRLYRVPPAGGVPVLVSDRQDLLQIRCPLRQGTCLAQLAGEGGHHTYNQLDPLQGIGPVVFRDPAIWGDSDWDVSCDGNSLALLAPPSAGSEIHVVDLKRGVSLRLPNSEGQTPVAINWDAVGSSLLLSSHAADGRFDLRRMNLSEYSRPLVSTQRSTWAVPSPDGKRVAFLDQSTDSNLWRLRLAE